MSFLYFFLGTIFGSFYNVVIFRLPHNKSIVSPRSYCYSCNRTLPFYLNIPIISFILCRGKCFYCKTNISFQYPIIEILTGLLWYIALTNYTLDKAILFIWMSGILSIIALVDLKFFIIPTTLITYALIGLISYNIYNINNIYNFIYGLLFGLLYLGGVALFSSFLSKKQTLGFGDILLIIILGGWLGLTKIALSIFISSLFALIAWLLISIKSGFIPNRKLPFGFYLSTVSIFIYIIKIDSLLLFF